MPRRYFNWKLAIVLIISLCVLGVTAFGLRQWQRTHRADQGLILGNKAYDEQKWDEAAEYFGRYIAIEKNDVPILMKYAEAQLKIRPSKNSNIAHALNIYHSVLRADRSNSKAAKQLIELYLAMGNPGEAELIASKYLDNNDDPDPKLLRMLAMALIGQRKFSEAALHLETIIQEHPDQILAYEMMGQLVKNRPDDVPVSPEMLEQLVKNRPDDVPVSPEMLGQLIKNRPDEPNSPESWFNEAVKNNPASAMAYTGRAAFYRGSNDIPKALADLGDAENRDLSDPNVELRLAVEFMNANILNKAELHLISVQTANPKNLGLWTVWAELAKKSNSKEKMLKIAETGLKELSSQPWDFMPTATELFIRSGQFERADECISEMNQKDIAPMEVTFLEGLLASESGHLFEAIDYWQESIGLGNKSPQVRLALSLALSRIGDTQSAIIHLRTLVSENPDYVAGHLALARLFAQNEIWAESSRYAATTKQLSQKNPEASLLYLQAQMQIRKAGSVDENILTFQDIDKQLSEMDKVVNNLIEDKLSKFQLALQQSNFTDAQALITQLIKDYPSQIKTTIAECKLLVAQDKTDDAISILIEKELSELEKAVNNLLEVKLLKFQLALLQSESNFTDAQALITQLKKGYPSEIRTTISECKLLVAQDKTDDAILILTRALDEFPQAIDPVGYLANLLNRQGDKEKCEEIIKEALKHIDQPVNQRKLGLLLADYYVRWNQKDNAYKLLNTLVQKWPEDILLKRRLLYCEQVINDRGKAQQLVEDIKSLEGEEGWQWRYEQAKIWYLSEDFEARYAQIVERLQENVRANPNDQSSRILLAIAYDRSGELQLAISEYREALRRSPDDLRIIIPAVAALYKAKEDEEAGRLLERASRQKLNNPQLQQLQDLQYLSYQSYLRRDELGSAADVLEDFLSNDPNNQDVRLDLAELKTQQGHFDEAEELLTQLKIQDPNSLKIVAAQVQLNISQKKTTEALRLCDEIVDNLNNAKAYIFRARTNTILKEIDKAIEDFEHAAAIEPNNVEVWMAKSAFYRSIGQQKKAIEDFERTAAIEPNNVEVWLTKSEFYRFIGRPDKAIADIQYARSLASDDIRIQKQAILLLLESGDADKVLQGKTILTEARISSPNDIDLRLLKANSLLMENTAPTTEEAVSILQKITDDQPEISMAWVLLGNISLDKKQAEKAMEIAFRGLSHTPNDMGLLLLKARAEADRSPVLAIPTLKALLEAGPNNTDATLLLARIYIAVGESGKAVNLLEAQLASRIGTSEERIIKIALAVALHKNGDKADAQKHFDSLLQSEPDDPTPLLNQVELLRDEQLWTQLYQKVDEWYHEHPEDSRTLINIAWKLRKINDSQAQKTAENILRRILENNSDSIEAKFYLATLLQANGRPEEAAPLFETVLELQPDNKEVINNLAWLMCKDQGRLQKALELAQKGLKKYPNYLDLIDTRGFIYYQMGEYDKAVEDFTTCTEKYLKGIPAVVASHFHLAKTFVKLGQNVKAVNHLNQALNLERQIGGLSNLDIDEAQRLLKQLQEGN